MISIITPSFNSENTIGRTIESVLSQSFKDFELLIIDAKSSDTTVKIAECYNDSRIKIFSESDNGLYDAMNKGIKKAKGNIIGILNSDDFFSSSTILEVINNEFQNKKVECVYGDIMFCEQYNECKIIRYWKTRTYNTGDFLLGWHPPHPSFYVLKKCYENFGLYDTEIGISADFELMLRFIEINKISISYIQEYIVTMRYGGKSTGSIKYILQGFSSIKKSFNKHNIDISTSYFLKRYFNKILQLIK